jgi:hypothetical protein
MDPEVRRTDGNFRGERPTWPLDFLGLPPLLWEPREVWGEAAEDPEMGGGTRVRSKEREEPASVVVA